MSEASPHVSPLDFFEAPSATCDEVGTCLCCCCSLQDIKLSLWIFGIGDKLTHSQPLPSQRRPSMHSPPDLAGPALLCKSVQSWPLPRPFTHTIQAQETPILKKRKGPLDVWGATSSVYCVYFCWVWESWVDFKMTSGERHILGFISKVHCDVLHFQTWWQVESRLHNSATKKKHLIESASASELTFKLI